ncbi:MAG TPA: GNAT family N-acetyltransferase [Candidatus Dormibacteraeota bacterium]
MGEGVAIRKLNADDAAAYRAFRLQAIRETPLAFSSSVDEESAKPLTATVERLVPPGRPDDAVFGAFDDAGELIGIVGLTVATRPQECHNATLFGMGVAPRATRRGVGRALVLRCLEHASSVPGVLQVQLRVSEGNAAAERLYRSCGFEEWGRHPRAVMVQGTAVTKIHMVRMLDT